MLGLMNNKPLLVSGLMEHAVRNHSTTEIVTNTVEGGIHRYTFKDCESRTKQMVNALGALGVKAGDRIGTMAWNTYRHLEVWYAVSGMGAVSHTINPRLFPEQISYIVNHAEDSFLFVDLTFVALLEKIAPQLNTVKGYVIMTDEEHMPETSLPNAYCYESLIAGKPTDYIWPTFDENTASSLCYTSGTTGNPKGVLFSHRSTILHTYGICLVDVMGLNSRDPVMPIVPMFHANAWGVPYGAFAVGAKLVFSGPHMDGKSLHQLICSEGVAMSAAVPTIWLGLLGYMEDTGARVESLSSVVIGGSAAPCSMIETLHDQYGVEVRHAWGMTEISPLGTVCTLKGNQIKLPRKAQLDLLCKQGRPVFGVELKIIDDDGNELPCDGKAFGNLMVRGPWVVSEYYKAEGGVVIDAEGWFDTGDVATIDPDGFMQITDRAKDVIKSGGEWISSIELENAAMAHPSVQEAAVIGISHPKWDERPLLIIVPRKDKKVGVSEMQQFLSDKVAKWWLPDDVVFVDELPHTATGKIHKLTLRETFKDYAFPGTGSNTA